MLKRSAVPNSLHPAGTGFLVVRGDKDTSDSEGTSSGRVSFSEKEAPRVSRMSPGLEFRFELALSLVSNPKIKGLFQENLQNVLCDQGLPGFVKELLIDKMSSMERILGSMALRSSSTLLLDSSGVSHFPKYEEASRNLKANLIKHKDPAGVTFSGRNLKLFSWCQAELKETVHPGVKYLLDKISPEGKLAAEAKFKLLADISNILILQIACGDDIADNIQNDVLVPIFSGIPISDDFRIQNGLKTREESRVFVEAHNNGIYLEYYDVAVAIWDDCIVQLATLFGESWATIEPGFLALHEKVMGSLTYSIFMNTQFTDKSITDQAILEHLAPNMMVECFRFLEKSLAQQIAEEHGIVLPESDLAICDQIVAQSQTSASLANATATAAREMRENDISNPIPFALNKLYMQSLEGRELGDVFEVFLQEHGYQNHFFAQYEYDEDKAPRGFDCLDLQLLRKVAVRRVVETLGSLCSRGLEIPDTDYSLASLAVNTLKNITNSKNVLHHHDSKTLKKLTTHIQLIDVFFDKALVETKVEEQLFQKWADDILQMTHVADAIVDESLRAHAKTYVRSWEDFLCMRLLFNCESA